MKLLYLGGNSGTALHRCNAFRRLGHDVVTCDPDGFAPKGKFLAKFHYETGGIFASKSVAAKVVEDIGTWSGDAVFVDGGRFVGPELVAALRKRAPKIAMYNVDDPYGKRDRMSWSLLKKTTKHYDQIAVVREENVSEAKALGCRNVMRVYRSADEVAHRYRTLPAEQFAKWQSQVVFVGTAFENRGSIMATLIDLGVPLSLYGNRYDRSNLWPKLKPYWKGPGTTDDDDYAAAILSSKICIGLLSSGNRDLHTTRSLEIPYMGGLFCAQRTTEHLFLYEDGEEAVFWSSLEECAEKCKELLADPERRDRIALAGHQRALRNNLRNEVVMGQILEAVNSL